MINVIGLGYIGLPTALVLAANGNEVVGTDVNKDILNKLHEREITFEEQGLQVLFEKALKNKISFEYKYSETNFYIITVPTPYNKVSKKIDPTYVIEAVKQVLEVCKRDTIIVIESTVSPGTIDKYVRPLVNETNYILGEDIHLVHAPERILPGQMLVELQSNSRTIGADSLDIAEKVKKVYSSFCKGKIAITDIRTAEITKVIENTYRAVNIAFANEITKIARYEDLDIYEMIRIANMHPRVNILNPGPGVGGHCIPVDPWFLVGDYPRMTTLTSAALETNESMPSYILSRIREVMKEQGINGKEKVGIYGLTYKPDVDDVRESPTLQMFENMSDNFSSHFRVYDPMLSKKVIESQIFDFDEFISKSEVIVIMQSHTHIKNNLDKLKGKLVLDTQNIMKGVYKL